MTLSYEVFAANLNTSFQIALEDSAQLQTELVEVSDRKLHPKQEEFSIVFRGPNETFLGQGIRSFNHEQMGEFQVFIVPIRQDQNGYYYEAVFNRFREDD
jgi:hypothetical protein